MNPYKVGDSVILLKDIRDAYGDVWHEVGDVEIVDRIANDGFGLMFSSQLGTHYKNVKPNIEENRDRKLTQILKLKILVFGEICNDVFIYGSSKRLSPEAPVPVFLPERTETNLGMAGNVMNNLNSICDCSVDIITQPETITKTRFVDDKSNHMFLRVDEGEGSISKFIMSEDIKEKIVNSDIVIVSDYNKGFLSLEDIKEIGKLSNLSIIDSKNRLTIDILKEFSFIKLNESEWLNNFEIASLFKDKVIITMGIRGCQYNDVTYESINPQVTMDVSGAGDTFTASFIVKYYETKNIIQSIEFANRMSSIVVSKRGVKTP